MIEYSILRIHFAKLEIKKLDCVGGQTKSGKLIICLHYRWQFVYDWDLTIFIVMPLYQPKKNHPSKNLGNKTVLTITQRRRDEFGEIVRDSTIFGKSNCWCFWRFLAVKEKKNNGEKGNFSVFFWLINRRAGRVVVWLAAVSYLSNVGR